MNPLKQPGNGDPEPTKSWESLARGAGAALAAYLESAGETTPLDRMHGEHMLRRLAIVLQTPGVTSEVFRCDAVGSDSYDCAYGFKAIVPKERLV